MWFLILVITGLFYLYTYYKQKFNFGKYDKIIAGPKTIPILGNALEFIGIGPEGKFRICYTKNLSVLKIDHL